MKKMMLTLSLAPFLALNVAARDTRWEDLALGDRIEITFHSGGTIMGTLVAPVPAGKEAAATTMNYARESALVLDVTWEYPGLNGTLSVLKKEIRSVRKLRVLDAETIRKLGELKKQLTAENEKAVVPKSPELSVPKNLAPEPKPEAPTDDAAKKAAEELQKAREFYAKYPAPDWNPERRNAIRLKMYRGQTPTPAEREFEAGFTLWEKGRAAVDKSPEPQKN
jgi:hypothetical protein